MGMIGRDHQPSTRWTRWTRWSATRAALIGLAALGVLLACKVEIRYLFCCLSKMSIKWLCVLTNGNIVKGKYLLGKNTSDWAIGWCNERKAYLFVCYLGRVSNDCRKLKSKKLVAICWELGGSGSSRWPKQTGSPVCHLSAYSSPALLGSFNPLPPHLARHVTNPLRGLFTWCRGGFPLAFSLASWREKN